MNKTGLWWGALGVWCVAALTVASDPRSAFEGIFVVGAALVLAIAWLVRLILTVRSGTEMRGLRLANLGLEALVSIAFVGLCTLKPPDKVRFRLSERALTAFAKDALAHPKKPLGSPRLGLYQFESGEVTEGEVNLTLGGRFLNTVGFVYAPASPKYRGETTFKHLRGAWYLWEMPF
jgi:hypothetical protein